jgi:plastocyanin
MQVLADRTASPKTERVTLAIEGLSCGGGGDLAADRALAHVPGVVRVYVNPATEMAYVEYAPGACSLTNLQTALQEAGLTGGPLAALVPSPAPPPAIPAPPLEHNCCESTALVAASSTGDRAANQPHSFGWRLAAFAIIAVLVLGTGLWLAWPHQPAPAARYSVDMSMAGFQPAALDIPAGQAVTVRLTNVDSPFHGITNGALHQFALDEINLDIRLDARQSQVITLPAMPTGTYTFYCDVCCGGKANKTMRGTLRVH